MKDEARKEEAAVRVPSEEHTGNAQTSATSVDLRPIRTLKGDLARLLASKKFSEKDLSGLDKSTRAELEAYASKGGDDDLLKTLDIFAKESRQPDFGAEGPGGFRLHKEGQAHTAPRLGPLRSQDIVAKQMQKARIRARDIGVEYKAQTPEEVTGGTPPAQKESAPEAPSRAVEAKEVFSSENERRTHAPPALHEKQPSVAQDTAQAAQEPPSPKPPQPPHEPHQLEQIEQIKQPSPDELKTAQIPPIYKKEVGGEEGVILPQHPPITAPPTKPHKPAPTHNLEPTQAAAEDAVEGDSEMIPLRPRGAHKEKAGFTPIYDAGTRQKEPKPAEKPQDKETRVLLELEKKERALKRELDEFPEKERSFNEAVHKLETQRERLANFIAPLKDKERGLEQKEDDIERMLDGEEDSRKRHDLEQGRWVLEDQRREVEEKRWDMDQEILKVVKGIDELSAQQEVMRQKKTEIETELEAIARKKKGLRAEKERDVYIEKIGRLEQEKEPLEMRWVELNEKKKHAEARLEELSHKEESARAMMRDISVREKQSTNPEERHKNEAERWKTEEGRRVIEKERWSLEQTTEQLDKDTDELADSYQTILDTEKMIENKIKELDSLILEQSS